MSETEKPKSKAHGQRRSISLKNQLEAALRQLGFEPNEVQLDHDPALALRRVDLETGECIPAHDDPRFLVWRPKAEHLQKTTGKRGESKLSKRGGDISEAAKVKRLAEHAEDFRRRMLAPNSDLIEEVGEGIVPPKGTKVKKAWPKRSFPKKPKPQRGLNGELS